jgi:hypothetical protein
VASCFVPEGTQASHRFPLTHITGVSMPNPVFLVLNVIFPPPTALKLLPKILELSSSSVGMSFRDTPGGYDK